MYILMEYASGGSLDQTLEASRNRQEPFSADALIAMCKQLVAGMNAVNEVILHRDIKPGNIVIKDETLKITDFGLAKLVAEATRELTFKGGGSFPYIAPEAWRGETNTIKLDIYALGMVFYELATLRHPFALETNDPEKWRQAHLYQPVTPPNRINSAIGTKLSQIILKMTEKRAAERFSDWQSILLLLEEAQPVSEENAALINRMLQKRLEEDAATQAAVAEAEQKAKQLEEFCRLVLFQFEQTLVAPVNQFVSEFNDAYPGRPARFSNHSSSTSTQFRIDMPSGANVSAEFHVLLEAAFTRQIRSRDDFGRQFTRTKVQVPSIRDRRVYGWGILEGSDKRGLNLLLVEVPGEIYGEWMMLVNTAGMFASSSRRPEPFAFGFSELEKAVAYIGVLHEYQIHAKPLDIKYIKEFIGTYA